MLLEVGETTVLVSTALKTKKTGYPGTMCNEWL